MSGFSVSRVFPPYRGNWFTSFQDLAAALIRRLRCNLPFIELHPPELVGRYYHFREGIKERSVRYEKRNYHQFDRQRNQNSDN